MTSSKRIPKFDTANLEVSTTEYTEDTSKVARKMSGEFAERTEVREHKRIPKFDTANLEVSTTEYTEDTSKVARKMSGEFAERTIVREHKRIPKFDNANLEVSKVYVTTPIYYVNDSPHIGHAYTSVVTDIIARFHKLLGSEVLFLTGTDEHGQKVQKSAAKIGLEPLEFATKISQKFRDLMSVLDIANTDFIRTTEDRHTDCVKYFWNKLFESGNIYLGEYAGWYCMRDEAFYDASELTKDGLAPTGAEVEWVKEPSYFFALSKWQDKLLELYETQDDFILPKNRKSEIVNFVKNGLTDLSISRTSFDWGIAVPNGNINDTRHVIYVWLDALANYISALGYGSENCEAFEQFWPANAHVVGKDILRFHAVYWPAFLMAASLPLPCHIVAHGWWTNEGNKISKSLGNVIDPFALVSEFGSDAVRYFLIKEVIFGNDGNYSKAGLINKINIDLANKLGNLFQRTLVFIHKNYESKVPIVTSEYIDQVYQSYLLKKAGNVFDENQVLIKHFKITEILDNIMSLVDDANVYIDHNAPWKLLKSNKGAANEVLYTLLELLRHIGVMLQPFMPKSSSLMLNQLSIDESERMFSNLCVNYAIKPGTELPVPQILFQKVNT